MAIIAKFTRTLPAPTATINGGFVFLLSTGWFTQSDLGAAGSPVDGGANSLANGGGDLQVFSDENVTNRLPIEVVSFVTGVTPTNYVWVRTPSYATGDKITIGKDDTQTVQPAVGAAFGRNATWIGFRYASHDGITDSTGNSTITQFGSPTVGVNQFGGASTVLNGSNQYGRASTSKVANAIGTISAWIKPDSLSFQDAPIGLYDASSADDWEALGVGLTGGAAYWMRYSDSYVSIPETSSPLTIGAWQEITAVAGSTTDRRIYLNAGSEGSSTTTKTGLGFTLDRITFGRRDDSTPGSYFHGEISEMIISDDELSLAYISSRNDNLSDPDSFGTSSEWVLVSGGGVTVDVDFNSKKPLITALIANTATSNLSSVNFFNSKPVISAAIENEAVDNLTGISFDVKKPVLSTSITNGSISNSIGVDFSTKKPEFLLGISNEDINNETSAAFSVNKTLFNLSVNNSIGTNLTSADFSFKKPSFSAAIDNSAGANLSEINITVKKPIISASINNELINNASSIDFVVKSPLFTVNVQNGEIVVKFNKETNYTQESLSTNYSIPNLSTNYTQG